MKTGIDAFLEGLVDLGFTPQVLENKPEHVIFGYEIETGRHANKKIMLGLVIPSDFPMSPPSGPHVNSEIHPIQSGGVHPTGGIHQSPDFQTALGGNWQYWSRPYPDWLQGKKTVASYLSHIWRLWDSQ